MHLYLQEGRTKKSLTEKYYLGSDTITYWLHQRRKECKTNPAIKLETGSLEENKRLRRKLQELKMENEFLKRLLHSLRRKSIGCLPVYPGI